MDQLLQDLDDTLMELGVPFTHEEVDRLLSNLGNNENDIHAQSN